ncbi:MAG: secretin N-terminal domain-containing protein [Candidatus Aenigmatarchaeota archaeon]
MNKKILLFIFSLLIIISLKAQEFQDLENVTFKSDFKKIEDRLPLQEEDIPKERTSLPKEETRISLSLKNIDIIEALKFFSLKSGLNIVPTQKVSGRVTLNVENVPIKDVLDIMLRSNNLAYDIKGDIYNVMTEEEYKRLYGRHFFDTRKVEVFKLKYAIPEQAFSLLDAIKSDIGRLLVDTESGAVLLIDTPEKIMEAKRTLNALEQKVTLKVFDLQYANAKDVETQLKNHLDLKKVGSVKADERTNQIIVQTLPERMKNIEELIKNLDKKTKAVLIDTKIIKIKLTKKKEEGVEWEGLFNIAKQYGMAYIGSFPFINIPSSVASSFTTRLDVYNSDAQIGHYPFSGTTSDLSASRKISPGKLHIGIVDRKRDFDALIKFLQSLGESKIIASPSLAVVNNQEAKIHIGERQAYITTTTTTGTTTKTVSEEVTYVDVGVKLSVIPTINDEGYITIKIKPEISSVIGTVTTSSGNTVPIIDTNTAETTVIAKDRSTIIIGGLGREEKIGSSEGVPILSKIPIFGFLFRSGVVSKEHVELVIMLTPIIFEGDKFITPKEVDKFQAKPSKKFDVFSSTPPKEEFVDKPLSLPIEFKNKEFKSYDTGEILIRKEEKKLEKEEKIKEETIKEFKNKGFKPYESLNIDLIPPQDVMISNLEKELIPKGFKERTYTQ